MVGRPAGRQACPGFGNKVQFGPHGLLEYAPAPFSRCRSKQHIEEADASPAVRVGTPPDSSLPSIPSPFIGQKILHMVKERYWFFLDQ